MWDLSFIHSFIYMTAIYCVPTLSQPSLLGYRGEPEPGPCFQDPDKDLPQWWKFCQWPQWGLGSKEKGTSMDSQGAF